LNQQTQNQEIVKHESINQFRYAHSLFCFRFLWGWRELAHIVSLHTRDQDVLVVRFRHRLIESLRDVTVQRSKRNVHHVDKGIVNTGLEQSALAAPLIALPCREVEHHDVAAKGDNGGIPHHLESSLRI